MVICRVIGGLGNQMFQYAAGRALSLAMGSSLFLDLNAFRGYTLHNGFEIGRVFTASVVEAADNEISRMLGWRSRAWAIKLLARVKSSWLHGHNLLVEPHFNYWSGFREVAREAYLMGYWQSEKYFVDFKNIIRDDFTFKVPLEGRNLEISERMQTCDSVSIHIRRGDYLTNSATSKTLSVCSIDYYKNAIKHITEKITHPNFFVFSDDQQWAKNNIKILFPVEFIDWNRGLNSHFDMRLISLCKHQIIANSSFSWWGAWLNKNPEKIVIAPSDWFCNGLNDSDLIPTQWTRL